MRVIIGCEFSGVIRRAFRERGHDAWSCDLIPSEDNSEYHIRGDIISVLSQNWDLMICHPPCQFICSSGLHWNNRGRGHEETEKALIFVKQLLDAPINKICLENPIGCISTRIRKPDQKINPFQFCEDASKTTCLWLKNLPPLRPTGYVEPRLVKNKNGRIVKRWANQCDLGGQDKTAPSPDRWKTRSKTYFGVAKAMAEQWG